MVNWTCCSSVHLRRVQPYDADIPTLYANGLVLHTTPLAPSQGSPVVTQHIARLLPGTTWADAAAAPNSIPPPPSSAASDGSSGEAIGGGVSIGRDTVGGTPGNTGGAVGPLPTGASGYGSRLIVSFLGTTQSGEASVSVCRQIQSPCETSCGNGLDDVSWQAKVGAWDALGMGWDGASQ